MDRHLCGLLETTLLSTQSAATRGVSWHEGPSVHRTLARIRGDVLDRLHDTALTPGSVAARHGISTRTLHAIFARGGPSFGRRLLARRLKACRRGLGDSNLADWPLSAIGQRLCLDDSIHFSKAFRRAYGTSPRAFGTRRACEAGPPVTGTGGELARTAPHRDVVGRGRERPPDGPSAAMPAAMFPHRPRSAGVREGYRLPRPSRRREVSRTVARPDPPAPSSLHMDIKL